MINHCKSVLTLIFITFNQPAFFTQSKHSNSKVALIQVPFLPSVALSMPW